MSSPILGQWTKSARSTSFQPTSGILARERASAKIVSRWNDVPVADIGDEATVENGAIAEWICLTVRSRQVLINTSSNAE